jgi:hypothetical protein
MVDGEVAQGLLGIVSAPEEFFDLNVDVADNAFVGMDDPFWFSRRPDV